MHKGLFNETISYEFLPLKSLAIGDILLLLI